MKASTLLKRLSWRPTILVLAAMMLLPAAAPLAPASPTIPPDAACVGIQKRGSLALDQNKYWIAEPLLKEALAKAEAEDVTDLRLAKCLGELGRYYTVRGRFDIAESYLEKELALKEEILGLANGKSIPAMGSMILFYMNYGTVEKAEPLTWDMLNFVEGKLKEQSTQKARGKVKLQKGVALEAWCGVAAPVMREPLFEWAITCDAVGNAHRTAGNLDLADKLFKASLDLKQEILGQHHLSLASCYDNLGLVALQQKDYAEAEGYFRDALNITEQILGPTAPQVYARIDKLGRSLVKEGKFREAEQLYHRALTFFNGDDPKLGDASKVYYALGSLYQEEKNYGAAARCFQQGIHSFTYYNGSQAVGIVPYYEKLAYVYYYLGRRGESLNLKARALAISGAPEVEMTATAEKLSPAYLKVIKQGPANPVVSGEKVLAADGKTGDGQDKLAVAGDKTALGSANVMIAGSKSASKYKGGKRRHGYGYRRRHR